MNWINNGKKSLLGEIATRPRLKYFQGKIRGIAEQPLPSIVEVPVSHDGTDVLNYVRQEYKQSLNVDSRWSLFDKKSANYAPVGSILTVHYKEILTGQDATFTGFMLAVRRHTATPTIILRAIISGIGVEQVFNVFSPLVSKIECSRKATCLYGHKAYWVRHNPDWISRFFTPPDQKVSIRKIRAQRKAQAEQQSKAKDEGKE